MNQSKKSKRKRLLIINKNEKSPWFAFTNLSKNGKRTLKNKVYIYKAIDEVWNKLTNGSKNIEPRRIKMIDLKNCRVEDVPKIKLCASHALTPGEDAMIKLWAKHLKKMLEDEHADSIEFILPIPRRD